MLKKWGNVNCTKQVKKRTNRVYLSFCSLSFRCLFKSEERNIYQFQLSMSIRVV